MSPPLLTPHIDGPDSAESLFFIQGWPDDHTLWDEQVRGLSDHYRCIRVDLPNYPGAEQRRWGASHDDIVTGLAECIRKVSPNRPVTLIGHDWGAYWAYTLHHRHPELVERLVGLDVAPHMQPTLREGLMILAYQWWLLGAFVSGGPLGDWMTRRFAHLAGAPKQGSEVNAALNYPYLYIWRDLLTGRAQKRLAGYKPQVPVMFVYGAKKPGHFHSDHWLRLVKRGPQNQLVALEDTGHWVTQNPQLTPLLRDWLHRTSPQ